jgi:hypothetical protein
LGNTSPAPLDLVIKHTSASLPRVNRTGIAAATSLTPELELEAGFGVGAAFPAAARETTLINVLAGGAAGHCAILGTAAQSRATCSAWRTRVIVQATWRRDKKI